MLGIFLNFVVLIIALMIVDRDEIREGMGKLFLVTCGITVVNAIISYGLGPHIGILALAPLVIADTGLLIWWCGLSWAKALVVSGILLGANVALALLMS